MSIGMCFNNDEGAVIFPEKKTRLGMSTKEIYDALDQRDRLLEAYEEKLTECQKLRDALRKSSDRIFEVAMQYMDLANISKDPIIRLEFLSKSSGLQEAMRYMRMMCNGTDEDDILKGE